MATQTEIGNMALSHLGVGKEVASFTEGSEEASALNRFYDDARKATLRDFPWPFANVFETLALIGNPPSETDEWSFSYRYPVNALMIRRIQTGVRVENHQNRSRFKVARGTSGKIIYSDLEDAKIEYIFDETDPIRFDSDFVLALSYRLALYVLPRLSGGDPNNLRQSIAAMYRQELSMAQAAAANENVPDELPEAEMIRARDGDDTDD